ncbi:MAG TPA: MopE-related protein, partial [Candidatus Polarisedimenticolia bacterium]|nr:MopE-related protein [Candidatus Polarisedimenticolia bacterium]
FFAFDRSIHEETRRNAEARLEALGGSKAGLVESRDGFSVQPDGGKDHELKKAEGVRKQHLEDWWESVQSRFDPERVRARAAATTSPSLASFAGAASAQSCLPDDTWDNGTLDDVPDPRQAHSAVWTGSLMVVWGGYPASTWGDEDLDTGGRYDPATDTWTSTARLGAPSPRSRHTAVWAGGRMVVWGGYQDRGSNYLNTGGRYDPTTDSWLPTSLVGAPSARYGHTAVWTGSQVLIWGGTGGATGGRYDPASDQWTSISTAGAPGGGSGVWTGSQMLIWGGSGAVPGGRYDPAGDQWTPISTAGAPGAGKAVWTGSLMLVLQDDGVDAGGRYDPVGNQWTPINRSGAPNLTRPDATAVWSGSEMIYWGGSGLNTGGRYNPATDSWQPTSGVNAPEGRSSHSAVWTGTLMLIWGGFDAGGFDAPIGGRYDPSSDSWTPISSGPAPSPRESHTAVWTGTQMIVWGGWNVLDSLGNVEYLDTGGKYDPAMETWSPTTTVGAPSARIGHTAVWTGDRMVVWGGGTNTGGRYDPIVDVWTPTASAGAPAARSGHSAIWTGSRMVVWGGRDASGNFNTGGRYDPVADAWQPTSTSGAPAPRRSHAAVYTGTQMIVWGGVHSSSDPKNGGRYDPVLDSWSPTSTVNAPASPTQKMWGVWTGSEMLVWGEGPSGCFPCAGPIITGRYNPSTDQWNPITIASGVLPYAWPKFETVIWTGSRMLVWGGGFYDDFGEQLYATGGLYDPTTDSWTPTSTVGAASTRGFHTAVWTGTFMLIWGGETGDFSGPEYVLSSGGRYISGQSSDDDGDGFSECGGDCADGNAAVHPGAVETCNGVDDNCSATVDEGGNALCDDANACTTDSCGGSLGCAHPIRDLDGDAHPDAACGGNDCLDSNASVWLAPAAVSGLTVSTVSPAHLFWDSQAASSGPATLYDLASGTMGPAAGTLTFTPASCVQSSSSTTYADSRPGPTTGTAFWYLTRGRNACGTGTYGSTPRDTGIPSCP